MLPHERQNTAGRHSVPLPVPVSTKIPVPMIAPTPSAVRLTGEGPVETVIGQRFRLRAVTLFRRNKFIGEVGLELC